MKQENSKYLDKSSLLQIKKSNISGRGVFSNKKIKKWETICFMKGEELSLKIMLHKIKRGTEKPGDSLQIDDNAYIKLYDLYRCINHSCKPNCFIRGKNELVALKNISTEQEIVYDYSATMWGEPWWKKCLCGAPNCRGKIIQFYKLPIKVQKFFVKNKYLPDFILKKFIKEKAMELNMDHIKKIDTLTLSKYLNTFRQFLLKKGFFEHTLYSSVSFKVENATCFELNKKLFLRYGTEPDVWRIGEHFDKFFWIGSLYRNETKLTRIHNYEFKLVDFYISGGSIQNILNIFLNLLKQVEKSLDLIKLSRLEMKKISYMDFHKNEFRKDKKYWLVVTEYPIQESFYDKPLKCDTNKFELFFVNSGKVVEIASGGIVGPNINKEMYIKNIDKFTDKQLFDKEFIGLGIGVERLILVYSHFN